MAVPRCPGAKQTDLAALRRPAGEHVIEAVLVSLNLRSPHGTLQVVDASDEAPRMTYSAAQMAERRLREDADRALARFMSENPGTA
jgi:hypothetical protein